MCWIQPPLPLVQGAGPADGTAGPNPDQGEGVWTYTLPQRVRQLCRGNQNPIVCGRSQGEGQIDMFFFFFFSPSPREIGTSVVNRLHFILAVSCQLSFFHFSALLITYALHVALARSPITAAEADFTYVCLNLMHLYETFPAWFKLIL